MGQHKHPRTRPPGDGGDHEQEARIARAVHELWGKLDDSSLYLHIFNRRGDEQPPWQVLVELGAIVCLDKPLLLIVPEHQCSKLPENLRRLARHIEVYEEFDDPALTQSSMEAAVTRLHQALPGLGL